MTALIETVRVVGGRAPLWKLHMERLGAAAQALGLEIELPAVPGGDDRIVRYEIAGDRVTTTSRASSRPASMSLRVSVVPHEVYPWKTTDREVFDQAFLEARAADADDALLLSADGLVREASRWAVVWRRQDGRIGAPPLSSSVLRSVARSRLGQLLPGGIVEEELEIGRLFRCPVATLNAARGLVPVARIDGEAIPQWSGWSALAARFWP